MLVNGQLIQTRRRQLGLSIRELSKRSNIVPAAMKRLETEGDVGQISAHALGLVLEILNLRLSNIDIENIEGGTHEGTDGRTSTSQPPAKETQEEKPDGNNSQDLAKAIGSYLIEFGKGVHESALCRQFSTTGDQLSAALRFLETQLPAMGIMLHHASTGICLRPAHDAQIIEPSKQKERYLVNLQDPDLRILSRLLIQGELNYKQSTATPDGLIRVQRLIAAGLVVKEESCLTLSRSMNIATL
jgi:transcriptional regulator with XRE-family HTH domain